MAISMTAYPDELDVGPNASPAYVAECGSCHFAYQPGLLPERSWKRIMANLHDHYGDNAEVAIKQRQSIQDYLVAGSADRVSNQRSRSIMQSLGPGEVPLRITTSPYIAGIHGGLLEPLRGGTPKVESLSNCSTCHFKAAEGVFKARLYHVSDESFRGDAAVGMR
jgi:hypothetical protein